MIATLLFDIDGTLAETDPLHFQAFTDTFAQHGVPLDWDAYRARILGRNNPVIAAEFLPHVPVHEHAGIMSAKEAAYRDLATALEPAEGLIPLLEWAKGHDLRCGVVTNAPRPNAEHVLEKLGLSARFDVMVIGPELSDAKPHPLPYLKALEILGGDATRSVAFEDSPSGAQSALAAGLAVVGLTTTVPAETLASLGAGLVVPHFADPAVRDFIRARTGVAG